MSNMKNYFRLAVTNWFGFGGRKANGTDKSSSSSSSSRRSSGRKEGKKKRGNFRQRLSLELLEDRMLLTTAHGYEEEVYVDMPISSPNEVISSVSEPSVPMQALMATGSVRQMTTPELTVVNNDNKSVTVTINNPANAANFKCYHVQYKRATADNWLDWAPAMKIDSRTIDCANFLGHELDQTYVFRARKLSADTTKVRDSEWSGTYTIYAKLNKPQNLRVTETYEQDVTLTWTRSDAKNEDYYRIRYTTNPALPDAEWSVLSIDGKTDFQNGVGTCTIDHRNDKDTASLTIRGVLESGKTYYFKVRANSTTFHDSDLSDAASGTTKIQLATPSIQSAVDNKNSTITVKINNVGNAEYYRLHYKVNGGAAQSGGNVPVTAGAVTSWVFNANPGNSYSFAVVAVTSNSAFTDSRESGYSQSVTATQQLNTPQNLIVAECFEKGFKLTWSDLAHEDYYRIQYWDPYVSS